MPNFGCCFIWSAECVEKTDFVKLMRISRTHFDTITQIRVELVELVWHIVT